MAQMDAGPLSAGQLRRRAPLLALLLALLAAWFAWSGVVQWRADARESALASAWQTCGAAEPNHSAEDQAAQVCFSIIENHPFMDGNKRAGIHLLLLLLSLEKIEMHYTQDELVDLGYGLADGSLDFGYLRIWIKTHKN